MTLTTADGEHVIAWHVAPREDKPVILYFHGNGGALRYRVERFRKLIADGIGLVALEYRGYGGSSGTPERSRASSPMREAAYAFAADALSGEADRALGRSRSAPASRSRSRRKSRSGA